MASTNARLFERDNQSQLQEQVHTTLEHSYPQSSVFNRFDSRHSSNDAGRSSGGNSIQLLSPIRDDTYGMASTLNAGYSVPFVQQFEPPSFFGYSGKRGYCTSPTSSIACSSFNNGPAAGLNATLHPVDNYTGVHYTNHNANMNLDIDMNYQKIMGQSHENNTADNAAVWHAAQNVLGNYDPMNAIVQPVNQNDINLKNNQPLPTSASTQDLFQCSGSASHHIPDQVPINQADGEMEVEEVSSPELTEIQHRRALSDDTPFTPPRTTVKPRQRSLSITTHKGAGRRLSTSHLNPEERAERAGAAQGLEKGDKRRMQNKLAQRAFRARTKIVKNNSAGRLEHLEQLKKLQAERIGNLTCLVGRLKMENYSMKSAKFQETLMKNAMSGHSGPTA